LAAGDSEAADLAAGAVEDDDLGAAGAAAGAALAAARPVFSVEAEEGLAGSAFFSDAPLVFFVDFSIMA